MLVRRHHFLRSTFGCKHQDLRRPHEQSLMMDVSEPHLRHDAERQSRESLMQEQGDDRADERRNGGEL